MSGHNKFSNIKHRKAAVDSKRGQAFTKIARLITVAVRRSGANPDMNPSLRLALEKGRGVNMPKDTVERAIKKGLGELEGAQYEELTYEGYAAGGVAILAEGLTDNRNRTTPEVRRLFERAGGSLGEQGCVGWMFKRRGLITLKNHGRPEDELMELAMDLGADDLQSAGTDAVIVTSVESMEKVANGLRAKGVEPASTELSFLADNMIPVDADTARKVLRLVELLDDHDDIQNVHTNMDIPASVQEELERS